MHTHAPELTPNLRAPMVESLRPPSKGTEGGNSGRMGVNSPVWAVLFLRYVTTVTVW